MEWEVVYFVGNKSHYSIKSVNTDWYLGEITVFCSYPLYIELISINLGSSLNVGWWWNIDWFKAPCKIIWIRTLNQNIIAVTIKSRTFQKEAVNGLDKKIFWIQNMDKWWNPIGYITWCQLVVKDHLVRTVRMKVLPYFYYIMLVVSSTWVLHFSFLTSTKSRPSRLRTGVYRWL